MSGEDRLTPPRHSDYLFGAIADAKLVLIEGSAHFPHLEASGHFLNCLKRFLDESG